MKTAKIFIHGHSQAVRLPKEFRFDVAEVYIEKSGEGVILTPKKPDAWRSVRAVAGKFKGALDRAQPEAFATEIGLHELHARYRRLHHGHSTS